MRRRAPSASARSPATGELTRCAADLAWSGIPNLREAIGRIRPRLRSYRDTSGRELLDMADGVFVSPDAPAPVRFLGEYDNVFLGHADRGRITGDIAWGAAWARRGSFFVEGYLAGAWRLPDRDDPARIELEAHRPLPRAAQGQVAWEASELVRFLAPGEARLEVVRVDESARHSRLGS
ncbi:MAG: DNA glycosylase AlkZ-like family protein [Candidatus Limnocylindrales bacterium]